MLMTVLDSADALQDDEAPAAYSSQHSLRRLKGIFGRYGARKFNRSP